MSDFIKVVLIYLVIFNIECVDRYVDMLKNAQAYLAKQLEPDAIKPNTAIKKATVRELWAVRGQRENKYKKTPHL